MGSQHSHTPERATQLSQAKEDVAVAERHLERVAERVATGALHDISAEEAWKVLRVVTAVEAPEDVGHLLAAQQGMRAALEQALRDGEAALDAQLHALHASQQPAEHAHAAVTQERGGTAAEQLQEVRTSTRLSCCPRCGLLLCGASAASGLVYQRPPSSCKRGRAPAGQPPSSCTAVLTAEYLRNAGRDTSDGGTVHCAHHSKECRGSSQPVDRRTELRWMGWWRGQQSRNR